MGLSNKEISVLNNITKSDSITIDTAILNKSNLLSTNLTYDSPMPQFKRAATDLGSRRRRRTRCTQSQDFSSQYTFLENSGSIVGRGSCGLVKLAKRNKDGKIFAVKIISQNSNTREKCFNELRILNTCKGNSNFVKLHEFHQDSENYYLVNEYIEGGNLQDHLNQRGILKEQEVKDLMRELSSGIGFLHDKGIVHRDLKPANILCVNSDYSAPCKITDFDLSYSDIDRAGNNNADNYNTSVPDSKRGDRSPGGRSVDSGAYSIDPIITMASAVGSPEYMSPQVADIFLTNSEFSDIVYTQACDIWSLGVIMYKALSGNFPFSPEECDELDCEWNCGGDCPYCSDSLFANIVRANFSFHGPIWETISDSAKDLITKCLRYHDFDRITAQEILEHPFLKTIDQNNLGIESLENLKQTQVHVDEEELDEVEVIEDPFYGNSKVNQNRDIQANQLEINSAAINVALHREISQNTLQTHYQHQGNNIRRNSASYHNSYKLIHEMNPLFINIIFYYGR